jgi:hypothetical protein
MAYLDRAWCLHRGADGDGLHSVHRWDLAQRGGGFHQVGRKVLLIYSGSYRGGGVCADTARCKLKTVGISYLNVQLLTGMGVCDSAREDCIAAANVLLRAMLARANA